MLKLAVLEASSYLCDSIFNLTGPALMFLNVYRQLQITPVCILFNWSRSSSSHNKISFLLFALGSLLDLQSSEWFYVTKLLLKYSLAGGNT